ncbi:hypothetical protein ES703_88752 [subsurface metagenome]
MFCPTINGECVGETCRDWDKESGQCAVQDGSPIALIREIATQYQQDMKRVLDILAATEEKTKFSCLWDRLHLRQILADTATPPDVKQIIEEAFEAPNSDVAEKLLKDAGLI